MSDTSVEKKLELVHQVRSQYQKNQYDLMNRENILYGKTVPFANESEGIIKDGTLKLRYALAFVLLLTIIIFDMSGKSFAGISMEQFFQIIEKDYEDKLEAWASNAIIKIERAE